jgi:hypothetical protein
MTDDVKQAAHPSGAEKSTNTGASESNSPEDHRPLDREHEDLLKNEHVAAIVENLTSGPEPEPEVETPPEPEPKAADKTPEPPAPTSHDSSKPEVKQVKEPAAPAATDLSYPDDAELKTYTGHSQKRIRQLIAARKSVDDRFAKADAEIKTLREKAKYREDVESKLTEHKIDTKAWDQWVDLGLLVQREPDKAGQILAAMAKNLGVAIPDGATKTPDESVQLDPDLAELVKAYEMTEAAAKKVQAKRTPPRRPDAPPAAPASRGPALTVDPVDLGQQAIAAVDAEFRAKVPEWESLVDDVMKELAQYKGSPPHLWGTLARDCADRVVKRKVNAAIPPDPTLRPGGVRRGRVEDATTREGFADAIATGRFFSK